MRIAALVATLTVTACSPTVTGGPAGGMMPWLGTNTQNAFNAAQEHCAKYGKDARITQVTPYAGGAVAFDCVKS